MAIPLTSRERVLRALRHEEPDLVPVCLAYETPEGLARRYGQPYNPQLMRQDVYAVGLQSPPPNPRLRAYLPHVPDIATIDCWGVARWPSSTGQTYEVVGALEHLERPDELSDFPFPDVANDDAANGLAERVRTFHQQGLAVQGAMSQTIWELAWQMRGMERLMTDLYECPAFVERLFAEIAQRKMAMAERFVLAGVDILRLGDDVGTQRGMMISPQVWRRFLKPPLAQIIAAARQLRPDLPIFYHSDGDVRAIIDDLIEIGVTILNPVQPECMDPLAIKRRYGDRLTLWGTLGTQTTLPFGTPAEVERIVRQLIEDLAPGGGYVIGPTHSVNADVSWENVCAFYEAVDRYGRY